MTDNATAPKLDLAHEALILASLIEGLSVIHEAGMDDSGGGIIGKRASNSLGPMFDAVIEKAWALTDGIEREKANKQTKELVANS